MILGIAAKRSSKMAALVFGPDLRAYGCVDWSYNMGGSFQREPGGHRGDRNRHCERRRAGLAADYHICDTNHQCY